MGKLVFLRKRLAGLNPSALERFVRRARRELRLRGTVNVLLTNSAEMRALNRQFRHKDKATDVLSFPSLEVLRTPARAAGELAISLDIARENANHLGHAVAEEVKILVLHGILHLAGFDHERDNGEMAREESRLRRKLKLNVTLIARSSAQSAIRKRRPVSTPARRRTV
ncbi:MAG TPA: rRNA maturation RNase YbeY [Candidatus Sulfotelmatobacter sp.]